MNSEIKTKWIAALRSGNYKQGKGYLRKSTKEGDTFCCLGVLCDIVNPDRWVYTGFSGFSHEGHAFRPSENINKLSGLSDQNLSTFINLNDGELFSFDQIANYIETNL